MRLCLECKGSGRPRPTDTDRALALGISVDVYRRRWAKRFEDLAIELTGLVGSISRPLRRQLERQGLRFE